MKRPSGFAAPISIVLALVFPAMVSAALALAYYGYQYADSASRPIEALFKETSHQEADKITDDFEKRVDQPAVALFDALDRERREASKPSLCEVDPPVPAMIESYIVLRADRTLECTWPPTVSRKKLQQAWEQYRKGLSWSSVPLGSYHNYHDIVDDSSVLIVYSARRLDDDQRYYVAARLNTKVIAGPWLDEALGRARKTQRVAIVDEDGNAVSGTPLGQHDERFLFETQFGKALYRWRIQITPQNVDAYQAQAERQKRLRPLLIGLSTVIMVVGLGIVFLSIRGERRASRLKSDFIANVSHELKTPLSLIRMFGEMVASGRHKGESAAREYGAIITRESERLSHLIDNVLDFARLERGKASYDFAEGDVAEVVERALDVCRYRLEKERMKLRTQIEPALPPVRMDENAMTLVVLNLVDNAIKYAADGGEVEVRVERTPGGVVLAVRDFGPGIAAEERGRVFERFYRARSARDRNVRGSGIGLSLVKHIAEAHGGRVTVESPAPEAHADRPGAVFRVHLPAPVPEGAESGQRHDVPVAAETSR